MKSSAELLHQLVHARSLKAVASELKISSSLLYRWCLPSQGSGTQNPLDRVQQLIQVLADPAPLHWLCQENNGFFVGNPGLADQKPGPVLHTTQQMLKEFSEMLSVISEAVCGDQTIDTEEAGRIRKEWEELKCLTERFVVSCERGEFA